MRREDERGMATDEVAMDDLMQLLGQTVTIAHCEVIGERSNFDFQVSVEGTLEKNDTEDRFRVCSGEATFAYFELRNVKMIVQKRYSHIIRTVFYVEKS